MTARILSVGFMMASGVTLAQILDSTTHISLGAALAAGTAVVSGTWWLSRKFQAIEDRDASVATALAEHAKTEAAIATALAEHVKAETSRFDILERQLPCRAATCPPVIAPMPPTTTTPAHN